MLLRPLLLVCLVGCSSLGSSLDLGDEGPAFYSYENDEGRTVFVSDPSMIPAEAQALPVDVSDVELNHELGRELDEAVHAEHARLVATDWCAEERNTAARGTIEQIWNEQPHWVGIGALVLLLLLSAPFIARRVGAPKWIRMLAFVIPVLFLLGVLTQSLVGATETLQAARDVAPLCEADVLNEASPAERVGIVQRLRRAYERREARIEAVIESAR